VAGAPRIVAHLSCAAYRRGDALQREPGVTWPRLPLMAWVFMSIPSGLRDFMGIGVLWSKDEDQCLRSLAQSGLAIRQIALRMNRSDAAIRKHAAKLKIGIAGGRNVMATVERLAGLGLKGKSK